LVASSDTDFPLGTEERKQQPIVDNRCANPLEMTNGPPGQQDPGEDPGLVRQKPTEYDETVTTRVAADDNRGGRSSGEGEVNSESVCGRHH
jgi:hypothetical protein